MFRTVSVPQKEHALDIMKRLTNSNDHFTCPCLANLLFPPVEGPVSHTAWRDDTEVCDTASWRGREPSWMCDVSVPNTDVKDRDRHVKEKSRTGVPVCWGILCLARCFAIGREGASSDRTSGVIGLPE